jgi:DNA invertase Pin-like site-specific DNA recombinase
MIEDELRQLGVQFAYVLNETDDSDEGMVMDGLRSLFDAWERKKIARRLQDGRQNKSNRGALWRGRRPPLTYKQSSRCARMTPTDGPRTSGAWSSASRFTPMGASASSTRCAASQGRCRRGKERRRSV